MTLTDFLIILLKTVFVTIPKYFFKALFWIIQKTWTILWQIMDVLSRILFGILKFAAIFLLFAFIDNMDDMY